MSVLDYQARRSAKPPLLEGAAIIACCVALIAISVRVYRKPASGTVYTVFTQAADRWAGSQNLYRRGSPYRYGPIVAASLVPLAKLPDRIGGIIWRLICAGVFGMGLWRCWQAGIPPLRGEPDPAKPDWTRSQLVALLFLLVLPDLAANLNNGQANPLVIGLLMWAAGSVVKERWKVAAACIAIAALFKVYPLAFGMVLVLLYPKRFSAPLLIALLVGLLLPFVLQRPGYVWSQYQLWYQYVFHDERQAKAIDTWYRDLRLPLAAWFGINLGTTMYLLIEIVGGAAIALVCLLGQHLKFDRSLLMTLALSLCCCWMTILGPATESSTYVLVAPAVAWTIFRAWDARDLAPPRLLALRIAAVASYLLLLSIRFITWFGRPKLLTYSNTNFLGTLLLAGCVCVLFALDQRRIANRSK